jgi:hypothetical protein
LKPVDENASLTEPPAEDASHKSITISSVAQLVSFQITERCLLKARAVIDGKELRGGTLELLAAQTTH